MRIRKQLASSILGTTAAPPLSRRLPPLPWEYSARGLLHSSVSDDSPLPTDAIPDAIAPRPPQEQRLLPPIPKVEEEIVGNEMIKVEESMSDNFGWRATASQCLDRPNMEVKKEGIEMIKVEESMSNNFGRRPNMEVKKELDGDVIRCKRNDGIGWRCKRDAALPSTLCSHHLAQSRSSQLRRPSRAGTGTSRGKSRKKRRRMSATATGSGSDCYYYYCSSFEPRRKKGRGEDQKGKVVVAEAEEEGQGSREQVEDDGGCAEDAEEIEDGGIGWLCGGGDDVEVKARAK